VDQEEELILPAVVEQLLKMVQLLEHYLLVALVEMVQTMLAVMLEMAVPVEQAKHLLL
jgi:hypothetical protein